MAEIVPVVESIAKHLLSHKQTLTTAESCTGGWIAKILTDLRGASEWFEMGFVTYSNTAKIEQLQVPAEILEIHGAVSQEVVEAMAIGARQAASADYAIAVSGIAGPDGGTQEKPVGTVWIAFATPTSCLSQVFWFQGNRDAVRCQAVVAALENLLRVME